jgi:hypothetical protein
MALRVLPAPVNDDLFALSKHRSPQLVRIGSVLPAIVVDNFYAEPDAIRESALELEYTAPEFANTHCYPNGCVEFLIFGGDANDDQY